MTEYILTTPDRRQRLCSGGQLGSSAPPLVFYSEARARAIADSQPDLRPLQLTPVRYTMPDTLPQSAVDAEGTIAAICAQLARPAPPSIDPVMQPLVYGEMLGRSYLSVAIAVHDAAMALAESIGTIAL